MKYGDNEQYLKSKKVQKGKIQNRIIAKADL